MNPSIFISGATSGIGKACSYKFASQKYNLILAGRRVDRLQKLQSELQDKYDVRVCVLGFDVRDIQSVKKCISSIPSEFLPINIVVNNAGLSKGKDPIQTGNVTYWDTMIDTNVKGLLYVTEAILPFIPNDGSGHIINIGSIAGQESYPGGSVYCASKHAVEGLTNGMRMDLLSENIRVSGINPGLVETEFSVVRYDGDKQQADETYIGMTPLTGEDIAESVFWVANQPKHVNVARMLILPSDQADSTIVKRK